MLLRVPADQISTYWEAEIKPALRRSLPPTAEYFEGAMTFALGELLSGRMQCWLLHEQTNGTLNVYALMTTTFVTEPGIGIRNLLIYSLFGYQVIPENIYKKALEDLRVFAKENKCKKILAYTNVQQIVDTVINVLGGNVDFKLVSLEV